MSWYCYMVKCADGTLYAGHTSDLARRVAEHNSSKRGAKYTRYRRPVELVYSCGFEDRGAAARQEASIKRKSRSEKEKLIRL